MKENSFTYNVGHLSWMNLCNWCAYAITNNYSKNCSDLNHALTSTLHGVYRPFAAGVT